VDSVDVNSGSAFGGTNATLVIVEVQRTDLELAMTGGLKAEKRASCGVPAKRAVHARGICKSRAEAGAELAFSYQRYAFAQAGRAIGRLAGPTSGRCWMVG